jgi:hypothetical protein
VCVTSLPVVRNRNPSYDRPVRWRVLTACLLGLGLGVGLGLTTGGCFHPDVKNGGFACSMTDDPPCPQGFFCVGGLCQDHPGVATDNPDLSTGTGGNGGGGGGGGGGGTTTLDMTQPSQDLSSTDMAQAPMCGAAGDSCNSGTDCCKMVCAFNLCVF